MRGSYFAYRRRLTAYSRELRRALTPAEKKLWFDFLRHLRPKFTRQKPLDNFIADFYCAAHQLAVEIDGDSHFTAAGKKDDRIRSASLEEKGLRILRFTNEDVMQRFEAVCLEIAALLKRPKA